MKLAIRSRGFVLTESLQNHAERRLAFALSRFSRHLAAVFLRMEDTNGPKGGADKRCRIETRLDGQPALVAEAMDADLYAAIDRATERIGRAVSRTLERNQNRLAKRPLDWVADPAQA